MGFPNHSLSRLLLNRRRQIRSLSSLLSPSSSPYSSSAELHQFRNTSSPYLTTNIFFKHSPSPSSSFSNASSFPPFGFSCFRCFSTGDAQFEGPEFASDDVLTTQSELSDIADFSVSSGDYIAVGGGGGGGVEDAVLPVRYLISLLDGFHDFTGLSWWMIIVSSTLALRVAILPILILQLNKLKRIGELFPKLPPMLPPPVSGRSYKEQFRLFWIEKRAVGCPSLLWVIAYISVQIPCFLLGMTTIRSMSLDHHPGFDCEGILWFQNLTELPHGVLGSILPMLIACLHLVNVQVSLHKSSLGKNSSLLMYYSYYLRALTVPILFAGFCVPQGSLVYWVTNSSFTLIQQLALIHPHVRDKLGLPDKGGSAKAGIAREVSAPGATSLGPLEKHVKVPVKNLSPSELVNLSIKLLAEGSNDRAIPLLRLALEKDPEYLRALIAMGQTLVQNGLLAEASEYLERAVTKLFLLGHPREIEGVDFLIISSLWAGVAYARQGKNAEALVHLERIARLKVPEDEKTKAHYFDGLLILASTLLNEGRNDEAAKHVRTLAAHDPAYSTYLKDCETKDNFMEDLVSSRRRDY